MFSIFKSLSKSGQQKQTHEATRRMIRAMGGDPERLTPEELAELSDANRVLGARDDVSEWFKTFAQTGTAMITRQRALLDRAGALDTQRNQQAAREDARRAQLAQDVPVLSARQSAILDALPEGPVRDFFVSTLRTALIFDPVIRPAVAGDRSFCGGMPIAPPTLIWPQARAKDGRQTPCRFLCQFDLADLPADFGLRGLFPEDGALYVFEPPREGATSDPLVQHHSLHGAVEHALPAGLRPYSSHYRNPALPDLATGWLHETDGPAVSVGPKWPLALRLETQAPTSYHCYDYDLDIPDALLAPHDGAREDFFVHMFAALNAEGCGAKRDRLRIETVDFDGFPHVWGIIQRLLDQHGLLVELTEAFYRDRIAANEGRAPDIPVPDLWIKATEAERATEISRTQAGLADLAALRGEITGWQQRAAMRAPGEATRAEERAAFLAFWDSLSAEGGLMLEDRHQPPEWGINTAFRMREYYRRELDFGVIASLCTDPSVFPDEIADRMREVIASWHPATSLGPLQMLGHTSGIQGSEAPGEDLLLVRLPSSMLCDWDYGAGGAIQFWLSHEDFRLGHLDAVQIEEGV